MKGARACRDALYLTDPRVDQDKTARAKGNRTEGTCQWILEDPHSSLGTQAVLDYYGFVVVRAKEKR